METFEKELQRIHDKISISDDDCQSYTKMFDTIRNWLMTEMCQADEVFNRMFKGTRLFGSYSNSVRIIKPSEFDVSILLEFPFKLTVVISQRYPSFAEISSQDWRLERNYKKKYEEIFDGTDLNRNKIQNWISDIIKFVLSKRPVPNGYKITHTLKNVAQTIYVQENQSPHKNISIDFVPSIVMHNADIFKQGIRKYFNAEYFETLLAIPKYEQWHESKSNIFQLVNPAAERKILWDKQNLKPVYRLLKSLRDEHKLHRLKSYFLTNIFLLEIEKQPSSFWLKPVGELFVYMLNALVEYFRRDFLPLYWDRSYNLLSFLGRVDIIAYRNKLINLSNKIKPGSVPHLLQEFFKTTPQ